MAVNDDILKQRAAQQKADIEARRQRAQKDLRARGAITVVDPNALTNPNYYPFGQVDNKYLKAIPRYSNYVEQNPRSYDPRRSGGVAATGLENVSLKDLIQSGAIDSSALDSSILNSSLIDSSLQDSISAGLIDSTILNSIRPELLDSAVLDSSVLNPAILDSAMLDSAVLDSAITSPRISDSAVVDSVGNRGGLPVSTTKRVNGLPQASATDSAVVQLIADRVGQLMAAKDTSAVNDLAKRMGLPQIPQSKKSEETPKEKVVGVKVTKVGEGEASNDTQKKAESGKTAKSAPKGESLTDWMRQNKMGDKVSLAERGKIYKEMGINLGEYKGTAAQNIALLKALKTRKSDKNKSRELLPLDAPKIKPLKVEIKRPNIPSKLNIKK